MESDEHRHEEKPRVNKAAVAIFAISILLVAAGAIALLIVFKPTAEAKQPSNDVPKVEVVVAEVLDFRVFVSTQGVVAPRTETRVASEVSGKVVYIAGNFERGAEFNEGDVLLEIEAADYAAAVVAKRGDVEDARLGLLRAEVEVEKGKREWAKLGKGAKANPLVLGIPQLEKAKSMLRAMEAGLEKAERDLARTKIKAPYDGRVRSTATDLGSYVTIGTPLAELFGTEILEVRLPVSQGDYGFLDEIEGGAEVEFWSGGLRASGKVVRVEGEIDGRMRSRHLIAEIEGGKVVPGQFVEGRIAGEKLEGVIEVPRKAVHDRNRVLVAKRTEAGDELEFRTVEIVRTEKESLLVRPGDGSSGGLAAGMRVILTPLAAPINGMGIEVVGEETKQVDDLEGEVPG